VKATRMMHRSQSEPNQPAVPKHGLGPRPACKPVPPPKPYPRPPLTSPTSPPTPTKASGQNGRPALPPRPAHLGTLSTSTINIRRPGCRRPLTCVNDMAQNPLYMCRFIRLFVVLIQ